MTKVAQAEARRRDTRGHVCSARCTPSASGTRSRSRSRTRSNTGGELLAGGKRPEGDELRTTAGSTNRRSSSSPRTTPRVATEEVFGPALPIWRVNDLDEAIELAERLAVRARLLDLDARPWRSPRGRPSGIEAGYTWVNSPPDRLRRAAVRRLSRRAASARSTASRRSTTTWSPSPWSCGATRRHDRGALQLRDAGRPPARGRVAATRSRSAAPARSSPTPSCTTGSAARATCCASSGVGREDRVLMILDDTPTFPALFLGAMRIGRRSRAGLLPGHDRELRPLRARHLRAS